ncbi:MAG: hypothetical protein CSA84_07300 [Actinomycetales bacterium]|nr:MAG: hypothetical protein CSA84_07300 [Actinomycetales bacterium]
MQRRRFIGLVAILCLVAGVIGGYLSLALGIRPVEVSRFAHAERAPFIESFDPIALVTSGRSADARGLDYPPSELDLRAIIITPEEVRLLISGTTTRVLAGRHAWTLPDLAAAIADPNWITPPGPSLGAGQGYRLNSALIVDRGSLRIGPGVPRLEMTDSPSVFIGATNGALLRFTDVHVDAMRPSDPSVPDYQPFVMATDGSRMDISGSRLTNLGWDWNYSYGVSWSQRASGFVTDSSFDNNFIGLYTNNVHDLTVTDSQFNSNQLYGVDPHTYSSGLAFIRVTAERNGAHGIIFADNVVNSSVRDSVSRFNGENGIMMDEESTDNVITGNTVTDNGGDGIVTADSGNNLFEQNTVERNRVGMRIDPANTDTTLAHDNRFVDNALAVQNIVLDESNTQQANGGQWLPDRLRVVWAIVGASLVGVVGWAALLTMGRRRSLA